MGLLSKDDILKAEDLGTETVPVPEWGGEVLVRGMTGRERDRFEASILERRGKVDVPNIDNIRAKVVAHCIVGEDGQRLFTDQDADELGAKSGAAINRVYDVAARLSGLSEDDVQEMIEALHANPFDAPSSPSPNGSAAPQGSSSTAWEAGRSPSESP